MNINRRIVMALALMCVLFLSLIGYLTYFALFKAPGVSESEYVIREKAEDVMRGKIFDKNGIILAESTGEANKQKRVYPYNELYAHVIGYHSKIYGDSELEKERDKELKGETPLSNILKIDQKKGDDIHLTIDHAVQTKAAESLAGRKGAVVALDSATGAILAMYSNPSFNPNEDSLLENFDSMVQDTNSPFLSRANHGLYPPASTFKIITASALISSGLENVTINDTGKIKINNQTFKNYNSEAFGNLNLKRAFALSSNVAFCSWGSTLPSASLASMAESFGFNSSITKKMNVNKSSFPTRGQTADEMANVSIGQGNVLTTPLQMAYVASIIAQGGIANEPYLVEKVTGNQGAILQIEEPTRKRAIEESIAKKLQEYMVEVVKIGTAHGVALSNVQVAGKTGTAENEKEADHAWFVGYAPADNPKICIAVVIENAGETGAAAAVPAAKAILEAYFAE